MHDGPAISVLNITPSNTTVLNPTRAIYVGVAGNLNVVMYDGTTAIFNALAAGMYPLSVTKVMATSTTATNIIGLY
jgi:hypothetical protein